ncbi:hypothetical protein GUJ93_ZPchr0002g24316 [Zizania palustris]|uniref:Uncharacterized protein n=1 Tax=Zizania palustris TaxID=103762 RepID=A0A8J5S9V5_ZIZPA|nr:hypothetical protein GUJ93_ZPchr0002g24316 [Zizania palustris]
MALLSAAAAQVSFLHSISSYGIRAPFPCEARPRAPLRRGDLAIRMGGGPRTFPGGVSKWQWKRMQARKAKQLLKARLARERQLYEMRKRAELRDAVAHLELPWEPDSSAVAAAPNLLSVAADDQLKALADRFYRPGGVDLWNDRDGPKVFATPGTGRASARFFPKDAIHSVQPYALLGGGAEITPAARGSYSGATDRSDRAQGVRQNAAKKETHGVGGDHKPAVEYIERDGLWEPVNELDGGAHNNSSDRRWNDDDGDASDLEDMGDVDSQPKQRAAMVRRDRRKGSTARLEAANTTMAAGSSDFSDWHGNGVFSDQESTREDHLRQRWKERNSESESRWKRPMGRRQASSTDGRSAIGRHRVIGSNSFSDSEATSNGFEPKWRGRNREGAMNGVGRWNRSNGGSGNVARKGSMDDKFDSDSGSARDGSSRLEPEWNTWSRLKRGENGRGKPEPKHAAHTNKGERPGRFIKSSNGDGRRDRFVNHFPSDLEEPKWKPRRKEGAWASNGNGNGNGHREYSDDMNGRFRRGGNRAVRLSDANTTTTNDDKENGSKDGIGRNGSHRMSRNGGRRHRGDAYSLRPTSQLHSSGRERE